MLYKKFITTIAIVQDETLGGKFALPQDKTPCLLQPKEIENHLKSFYKDLSQITPQQVKNIKNQLCEKGWALYHHREKNQGQLKQFVAFSYYYEISDITDHISNTSSNMTTFMTRSFHVKKEKIEKLEVAE